MKFSWGTGIAIFYIAFVIVMVGMVVYSKSVDNSLVVENYYDEDIRYQQQIDKLENSAHLEKNVEITTADNFDLLIKFPEDIASIEGTVLLYKADDKSKDKKFDIKLDASNQMLIPAGEYRGTKLTLKIDWQGNGVPYYKEKDILLSY